MQEQKYPFKKVEKYWQKKWKKAKVYKTLEDESFPKDKRLYVLDMFPYPSGAGLHVGHPEGYTATDIYSRFKRMQGYNVLHPMGFDAFGLPAENYALKTGKHPKKTTKKNIKNFTRQIKSLGFSYDWDRCISTCDKDYYKWTEWLFLRLYEKGLAYQSEMPINWCSSCKTGLANEEVKDGKCERCGSVVVRKPVRQWVLKITDYADELLEGLDELDWPESIKTMQRNWIGKSIGANVDFKCENGEVITVFTTRVDTLFGCTFLCLSPEHKIAKSLITDEKRKECEDYIYSSSLKSDLERTDLAKEKTGVWTGSYAINPVNNKKVPIYLADYVLSTYGTGAIMAVPAHDLRDWDFAKKYNIPIIYVLKSSDDDYTKVFEDDGVHINSEFLDGLGKEEAISKMIDYLEKNNIGKKNVNYKLRDWVFSRQRFWGEPIPLIHCKDCGVVEETRLPIKLPKIKSYTPTDDGKSPLAKAEKWVKVKCPKCGKEAHRETNTMPQWAGSCWYYLRYLSPKSKNAFVERDKEQYWMPVDLYVGGAEHAVLHLLYARFWHRVLYDAGLVSTKEPFKRLINQGLVTAFAYQNSKKCLIPCDEVEEKNGKYFDKNTQEELTQVVAKMSKSLKNVVNPDNIISEYGADVLRLYEMFMGPLEASKPWNTKGLIGIWRFVDKIWRIANEKKIDRNSPMNREDEKLLNQTIKKVTIDTDSLQFNTAISSMMIFLQSVSKMQVIPYKMWSDFILLLSPYVPHLAEELNRKLCNKNFVVLSSWPNYDENKCEEENINIAVQINGKVRSVISVSKGTGENELLAIAKNDEKIQKFLASKEVVKQIAIVDKIVNLVVR